MLCVEQFAEIFQPNQDNTTILEEAENETWEVIILVTPEEVTKEIIKDIITPKKLLSFNVITGENNCPDKVRCCFMSYQCSHEVKTHSSNLEGSWDHNDWENWLWLRCFNYD